MLVPSVRFWQEFREDKKREIKSEKANYDKKFFFIFVSGILCMWFFWITGIFLSLFNMFYDVFGFLAFSTEYDIYIQITGFSLFYIGGIGYNMVLLVAGKYVRPAPSGALENHSLITKGPYGVVRHPLYVSYIFILLGLTLIFMIPWIMIPVLCVLIGIYPTAKAEEDVLVEQFGEEYIKYQERVGMLFPKRFHEEF